MEKTMIINDIERAMRSIGYTTNKSAVALATIEENQADWADGFSTMCIDEALQLTGDYSGFCRGDLKRWASAVRRNVREVAFYVVNAVCRSFHLATSTDEVVGRLSASLYIDSYEPLDSVGKLSKQVATVDIDSLFKPHKSMTQSLPQDCQAIVMQAKRDLRHLFRFLLEQLAALRQEATRKEAHEIDDVAAWVDDLHQRKSAIAAKCAKPIEEQEAKSEELHSSLILTPMQEDAFSLAVSRGYMSPNGDGSYEWKLRDVTLSYFLGRLFAGDYIHHDGKGDLWHKGDGYFPEKELCNLFSKKNIGSVRRGRLFSSLPEEHKIIESLIEEVGSQDIK